MLVEVLAEVLAVLVGVPAEVLALIIGVPAKELIVLVGVPAEVLADVLLARAGPPGMDVASLPKMKLCCRARRGATLLCSPCSVVPPPSAAEGWARMAVPPPNCSELARRAGRRGLREELPLPLCSPGCCTPTARGSSTRPAARRERRRRGSGREDGEGGVESMTRGPHRALRWSKPLHIGQTQPHPRPGAKSERF